MKISPRFTSAQDFKDGMARIWEGGAYGFIDKRGASRECAVRALLVNFLQRVCPG